jgi:hypothetical protein
MERPLALFPECVRTLYLAQPLGRTILFSLLLLVPLLGTAELLARSQFFKSHVIANDWGSIHNQFETQLGRLETVAANTGSIDCIFVGSSMVWHAFDPGEFSRVYAEETAREMKCFNFGVDGGVAATAGILAPILVQDYQPRYLIFGTDARDYAVPVDAADVTVQLDSPWIRHRQGEFTIRGWLYEHAHLSRAWESLGHLVRLQKTHLAVRSASNLDDGDYGFRPYDTVADYVMTSPLEHLDMEPVRYYRDLLSSFEIVPENVRGLQAIVGLKDEQTAVIIVEMPIPETYLDFFGQGEDDYQLFVSTVQEVANEHDVPFWQTRYLQMIPADGWMDYTHVNTKGSCLFTVWLTKRIAEMVATRETGALETPTTTRVR